MTRSSQLLVLFCLLCSLALWSCGDYGVRPELKDNRNILTPENIQLLQGIDWQLISFELAGGEITPIPANQLFTLSFREAEAVGHADLNWYSVAYKKDSTGQVRFPTINISDIATSPISMDNRYFDALRDANSYTASDSVLRIFYEGNRKVMNFKRRPFTSLMSFAALQNNQWRLRSFEELGMWIGDTTTTVQIPNDQIFTLFMQDSMRFAGRADCNRYIGTTDVTAPACNAIFRVPLLRLLPEGPVCGSGSMYNDYIKAIGSVLHYDVTDTSLHMYYDGGKRVMNFTRDTNSYPGDRTIESLAGTSWKLTAMFNYGTPLPYSHQQPYTLNITADSLYGQANCKSYALWYKLYPAGIFTVEPVRLVKGICGNDKESQVFFVRFISAISTVQRYEFTDDNTLVMYSIEEGGYRLLFVRQ